MKMRLLASKNRCLLIPLLLLLVSGCKHGSETYSEITNPTNRIEILGVSILPPQEKGWVFVKKHSGRIEFGKMGKNKSQSFAGMVVLSKLPLIQSEAEFFKVVSDQRKRDVGDPRYEILLNEETMSYEKGTPAVRFHTKFKDFGANNLPKAALYLVVEDYGIICRHPNHSNVAVCMGFSQRTLPEEASETLKAVADEFIKNAEFKQIEQ